MRVRGAAYATVMAMALVGLLMACEEAGLGDPDGASGDSR